MADRRGPTRRAGRGRRRPGRGGNRTRRPQDHTWQTRYAAHAHALTAAVAAEAACIPGLRVPVTAEANSDPDAPTNQGLPHPDYDDFTQPDPDHLELRLLRAALQAAPVPDWTGGHDADASEGTESTEDAS
jgi:hypothetical protein